MGRDPRASGEFLEAATVAGLASAGLDVAGPGRRAHARRRPSLTAELGVDLGVMISASHNPMPDNGIKFFARGGHKLADEVEEQIEARLQRGGWLRRPIGADVGRVRALRRRPSADYVRAPALVHAQPVSTACV